MNQAILSVLCRYRDRGIDFKQLREWLENEGAPVVAQIARVQLLKLKGESEAQSNGGVAQLPPACKCCLSVSSLV